MLYSAVIIRVVTQICRNDASRYLGRRYAYRIATCVSRYVLRCHKRYVNACILILQVQILSIYYVKCNICIWTTKQFTAWWIHNIDKYPVLPPAIYLKTTRHKFLSPPVNDIGSPRTTAPAHGHSTVLFLELQWMTRYYRHYLKVPASRCR